MVVSRKLAVVNFPVDLISLMEGPPAVLTADGEEAVDDEVPVVMGEPASPSNGPGGPFTYFSL